MNTIQFTSSLTPVEELNADWLIVPLAQDSVLDPVVSDLDRSLNGLVSGLRASGDTTGKLAELTTHFGPRGITSKRLLLVGMGTSQSMTRATVNDAIAAALRSISSRKFDRVAILLPRQLGLLDAYAGTIAVICGAAQGCYGPGVRKSEPSRHVPGEIVLIGQPSPTAMQRGIAEAEAVAMARELVNLPPNDLYPETFADRARSIVPNVQCEVWDEDRLAQERMGAILGVARAASRPPRLAILRYMNGGPAPTLAYVGKGVTFDSGGLSLKTNDQMVDMKCDMAGAATVLAAIQAIARLDVKVNLIGVLPLVENMPGGRAMKLGDVLTARNGKTIEVLNTDAEGRLILADALSYAVDQGASHIVDLATLTGACMVALGTEIAGLLSNNDGWADRVRTAVLRAGERAWPLPMDSDFDESIRSKVADIKNVGANRYGGAIIGAKFLQQFVGNVPWAHLDIAGPAWSDHDSAWRDAGGTGAFVRSLIELAVTY